VELLILVLFSLFAIALDGEHSIVERHLHIFLLDSRKLRANHVFPIGFADVRARRPVKCDGNGP